MSATLTREHTKPATVTTPTTAKRSSVVLVAAIAMLVIGVGAIAGGAFGAWFTYDQAVTENVTTPDDASIPETPVRGPFTMLSQAQIIQHHQLDSTGGLRYAEMPREVPQVDDQGNAILDDNGDPVLGPNAARASWINATALTSALYLGVLAYGLSALTIVVGIALIAGGFGFLALRSPKTA